jgi:hypothetical protein
LKIAPIKAEQAFDDPPVWIYHDIITEYQIKKMIDLARPKVKINFLRVKISKILIGNQLLRIKVGKSNSWRG